MYVRLDDVDKGLKEWQNWPTQSHRIQAQFIALYNRNVTTLEHLTDVVQTIIYIRWNELRRLSINDFAKRNPNMRPYLYDGLL